MNKQTDNNIDCNKINNYDDNNSSSNDYSSPKNKNIIKRNLILKHDYSQYDDSQCSSSKDLFSDESIIDKTSSLNCSINNSIVLSNLTIETSKNHSICQNDSSISIKLDKCSTPMKKKHTDNDINTNYESLDSSIDETNDENKIGDDKNIKTIHESDKEKLEESILINEKTPERNSATDDPTDNIDEYADILEKLYGTNLKDILIKNLKTEEKKSSQVDYDERLSQTEPSKKKSLQRREIKFSSSSSSSQDDDDNIYEDDDVDDDDDLINKKPLKPKEFLNITPIKQKTRKITFKDDSFINDSTESEPESDEEEEEEEEVDEEDENLSLSPIRLEKRLPKMTPVSELTKRVKAICDSDTEDEDFKDKNNTNVMTELTNKVKVLCDPDTEDENYNDKENIADDLKSNNKRLSFSDDSSSTDYNNDKLFKLINTKNKSKKTTKILNNLKIDKPKIKSFLGSLSDTVPLEQCHPDFKKYKGKFKRKKDELARELYNIFNKKIFNNYLPHDMELKWSVRLTSTAGYCKCKKKLIDDKLMRSCLIQLSIKVLDNEIKLSNTLIHEMCHAAVFLIDEIDNGGHGNVWKKWGIKANKIFPELDTIKTCHNYKIMKKYIYRCIECGYSFGRHSKSLDTKRHCCGHCKGKFELLINKITKDGIKLQTPQQRTPSAFALFVKNNYSRIKKQHTDVPHKDMMKILGQEYSNLKTNNTDLDKISKQIKAIDINDTPIDNIDTDPENLSDAINDDVSTSNGTSNDIIDTDAEN